MSVRAGIVVTGTEVLGGLISDANGPWLSEQLRAHGVELAHTIVVGDRPDDLVAALDFFRDVDVVITCGGFGPTADDLTADVVASWVGATMELDAELEERIWAIVTRLRARVGGEEAAMRAGARKQAHVPTGAAVLEPAGTAPGFILGESPMVVVLPGPPRELQSMWADAVDDGAVARPAGRRGRAGAADPAVLPAARAADRGDAARVGRGLAAARGDDVPAPR